MWLLKHACHHPRRTWAILCHWNITCRKMFFKKTKKRGKKSGLYVLPLLLVSLLISMPPFSQRTGIQRIRQINSFKLINFSNSAVTLRVVLSRSEN